MKDTHKDKQRKKYYRSNQENNSKIRYKEERNFNYKSTEDTSPNVIATVGFVTTGILLLSRLKNMFPARLPDKIRHVYSFISSEKYLSPYKDAMKDRMMHYFNYHEKFAILEPRKHKGKIIYTTPGDEKIKYMFIRDIVTYVDVLNSLLDTDRVKNNIEQNEIISIKNQLNTYLEMSIDKNHIIYNSINKREIYDNLDNITYYIGERIGINNEQMRVITRNVLRNRFHYVEVDNFENTRKLFRSELAKVVANFNITQMPIGPRVTINNKKYNLFDTGFPVKDPDSKLKMDIFKRLLSVDDRVLGLIGLSHEKIREQYPISYSFFSKLKKIPPKTYREFLTKYLDIIGYRFTEYADLNDIIMLEDTFTRYALGDFIKDEVFRHIPGGRSSIENIRKTLDVLDSSYDLFTLKETSKLYMTLHNRIKKLRESRDNLSKIISKHKERTLSNIKQHIIYSEYRDIPLDQDEINKKAMDILNQTYRAPRGMGKAKALLNTLINSNYIVQNDLKELRRTEYDKISIINKSNSLDLIYKAVVGFLKARNMYSADYDSALKEIMADDMISNIKSPYFKDAIKSLILNKRNIDTLSIMKDIRAISSYYNEDVNITLSTDDAIKSILSYFNGRLNSDDFTALSNKLNIAKKLAHTMSVNNKSIAKIYTYSKTLEHMIKNIKDIKYNDIYSKLIEYGDNPRSVLNRPIMNKKYNIKFLFTRPTPITGKTIKTSTFLAMNDKTIEIIVDLLLDDYSLGTIRREFRKELETYADQEIKINFLKNIHSASVDSMVNTFIPKVYRLVRENRDKGRDEIIRIAKEMIKSYISGVRLERYEYNNKVENILVLTNTKGEPIKKLTMPFGVGDTTYDPYSDEIISEYSDTKKTNMFSIGNTFYREVAIDLNSRQATGIFRSEQLRQMIEDTYLAKIIRQMPVNTYAALQKLDYFDPRAQSTVKSIWNAFDIIKAKSEIQNPLVKAIVSPTKLTTGHLNYLSKIGNAILDYRYIYNRLERRREAKILVFDVETFGLTSEVGGDISKLQFRKGVPKTYVGHAYSISLAGVRIDRIIDDNPLPDKISHIPLNDLLNEFVGSDDYDLYKDILTKRIPILHSRGDYKGELMMHGQILIREPLEIMYKTYNKLKKKPQSREYKAFMNFLIDNVLPLQPTERMRTISGFLKWLKLIASDFDKYTSKYQDVKKMMITLAERGYILGAYNKQFDISRMGLSKYKSIDLMYLFMALGKVKKDKSTINFMQVKDLEFFRQQYGVNFAFLEDFFRSAYNMSESEIYNIIGPSVNNITPEHFAPFDVASTVSILMNILSDRPAPTDDSRQYKYALGKFGNQLSALANKAYKKGDPGALLELIRSGLFGYVTDGRPVDNMLNKFILPTSSESMAKGNILAHTPEQSLMSFFYEFSGAHKQLYQKFNYMFLRRIDAKNGDLNDVSHLFPDHFWNKIIKENAKYLGFSAVSEKGVSDNFMPYAITDVVYLMKNEASAFSDVFKTMSMGSGFYVGNPLNGLSVYTKYPEKLNDKVKKVIMNEGVDLDIKNNDELRNKYLKLVSLFKDYNNATSREDASRIREELIEKIDDFNKSLGGVVLTGDVVLTRRSIRSENISSPLFRIKRGSRIEHIVFDTAGKIRNIVFYGSNDGNIMNKTIKAYVGGQKQVLTNYQVLNSTSQNLFKSIGGNIKDGFIGVSLDTVLNKQKVADIMESIMITSLYEGTPHPTSQDITNKLLVSSEYAAREITGDILINNNDILRKSAFFRARLLYSLGRPKSEILSVLYGNRSFRSNLFSSEKNINMVDELMTIGIDELVRNSIEGEKDADVIRNDYKKFIYKVSAYNYIMSNQYYTRDDLYKIDEKTLKSIMSAYNSIYTLNPNLIKGDRRRLIKNFLESYGIQRPGSDEVVIPKIVEAKKVETQDGDKVSQIFIRAKAKTFVLDVLDNQAGAVGATEDARFRLNIDKDIHFLESSFRRGIQKGTKKTPLDFATQYLVDYQAHATAAYAYDAIKESSEYKMPLDISERMRAEKFSLNVDVRKLENAVNRLREKNIDVDVINIDLTDKTKREENLRKLKEIVDDVQLLEKAKKQSGELTKNTLPGIVYYNNSIKSVPEFLAMATERGLSDDEINKVLGEDGLHTKNFILKNLDLPEDELRKIEKILNQRRKRVINLKARIAGKEQNIISLAPHVIGLYKTQVLDNNMYTEYVVEGINPDSASFGILATQIYDLYTHRKSGANIIADINSKLISHARTIQNILEDKHSPAAMIAELPIGIRGTAVAIDPEQYIGKNDRFVSVVDFTAFMDVFNKKDAMKLLKKDQRKLISNRILFDPDEILKLLPKDYQDINTVLKGENKRLGVNVTLDDKKYIALSRSNFVTVLNSINEKRKSNGLSEIKALPIASSYYGNPIHGSFPLTNEPIPMKLYVTADGVLKNAQIGLTSFIRDVIEKDFDSDQVYAIFLAMTPNKDLRNILLGNTADAYKKELYGFYKKKLSIIDEIIKDKTKDTIVLNKYSSRLAFLKSIVGNPTDELDSRLNRELRGDSSGEVFMNKMKLLFPDLVTNDSILLPEYEEKDGERIFKDFKEYKFVFGKTELTAAKPLQRCDLISTYYAALMGKNTIHVGYNLSRSMSNAISGLRNELTLQLGRDADDGMKEIIKEQLDYLGRLSNIPERLYESAIKSVKPKGAKQDVIFRDLLTSIRNKEMTQARNNLYNYLELTTSTQSEKNILNVIVDNTIKAMGETTLRTTTNTADSWIEQLSFHDIANINRKLINQTTIDDMFSFFKGKYGNENIGDFLYKSANDTMSRLVGNLKTTNAAGLAVFVAGALTLSALGGSSWYDSNIPGVVGGESNDNDIRWTFNNPITYFQRDLNVRNNMIDQISRNMIMQQNIFIMKHKVSKTNYLHMPTRNYKSKFLSL